MSQAVKYTVLAVAIASILVLAGAIINSLYPIEIINNFGTSLQGFLQVAGQYISNVRGAVNYFLGSPLPVTIALAWIFIIPFARLSYRVTIAIYKFINQ